MTSYLLDTDIVSDLVRNPLGRAAARIADVGEDKICTSIIVACKLRYGAAKKGSTRLAAQVDAVLDVIRILNFEPDADQRYGTLRTQLETAGTVIGANDMLIAAHALSIGATLVTGNEREFSRVKGLHLENWLRPAEGG
ncbi:type II toxin-antitoxin system VapC family toxin [Sphingomonas oligophenolica]|uniref:Ribonuclease VapC n=1 Tax=Sphingomonas oligophenolica TaxID=301154 RepID=A0ABU9XXR8_9SPHN